jgi:lipopolysaccharide transport system ATP-binding protein
MPAIEVSGLHKVFRIPHERRTTLTERVLGLFQPARYERFEALRGVDLVIEHGSFIGIIGSNGSGKSTLLKVIAGLLVPDGGAVRVDGSISALLELGLGFSPELTVRENVELYGAVLGYPRRQMAARIETAIRFAELERFRDQKLKNLSTGMQMRLGFATALQAASDIMLLDEILAVGDANFQRKCLDVFSDMKERRRTVVLVSHDLGQVRRFCDHVVLIDGGRVAAAGDADSVIASYLEGGGQAPMPAGAQRVGIGDGRALVRNGWMEDAAGHRVTEICSGDRPTLVLHVEAAEDLDNPVFSLMIRDRKGSSVYAVNTLWLKFRTGAVTAGKTVEVRMPFIAALRNGPYVIDAGVVDHTGAGVHDWVHNVANFVVTGSACLDGAVDLRAEFSWRLVEDAGDHKHAARDEPFAGGGALR